MALSETDRMRMNGEKERLKETGVTVGGAVLLRVLGQVRDQFVC